jgi:hypothetical protein
MRSIRSSLTATLRLAGIGGAAVATLLAFPVPASAAPAPPPAHNIATMPAGSVEVPANNCTLQSIGSGVNVRRQPTTNSASLGQLQRGQRVTSPGCTITFGQTVGPVCGRPANDVWWEVNFAGTHGWVTADCVNELV